MFKLVHKRIELILKLHMTVRTDRYTPITECSPENNRLQKFDGNPVIKIFRGDGQTLRYNLIN